MNDSDLYLAGNTIRDHAGANGLGLGVHHAGVAAGFGVLIHPLIHGLTILPDNVFLRNEGGDWVSEPAPAPDGGPDEEGDAEEGPEGEEAGSEEEEGLGEEDSESSGEWETDSGEGAPDSEEGGEGE